MSKEISQDDAARLRVGQTTTDRARTRTRGAATGGAPSRVGKILTASGTSSGAFFKVQIYDLTGTEVEGGPGTLTDAGYFLIALNLGSAVPAVNTLVILTFTDYRWVFRYD